MKTRFLTTTLLLLAISLIFWGCATGRAGRYIPIWMYPFAENANALAMTSCDFAGNPIILINQTAYESEEYPEWYWPFVYQHENQHVKDLLAYPTGCKDALERYRHDPQFKMEMELRAECVEFSALTSAKRVIRNEFFFRFYNQWILYGQHLSIDTFFKGLDCAREDVWIPPE